jgi:hypothetical protein
MPRFVFGTNDPTEAQKIMAIMLANAGQPGPGTTGVGSSPPPPSRPTALPPAPGGATPPPPPTVAATPPAPQNPRLDNVLKLMDAYSRAGHGVAGARKVLAQVQLSRAQDANEEQLDWLAQAFANTSWEPA